MFNMKHLFSLLLSITSLLSFGCAGISSSLPKQEVVGSWTNSHTSQSGTLPPQTTTTTLTLSLDGTYARVSEMYSDKGTWEIDGHRLILIQNELSAGLIPKKKPTRITFEILEKSENSLSLKFRDTVDTYTRRH